MWTKIKNIVLSTCFLFTLFTFIIYAFKGAFPSQTWGMSLSKTAVLLLFCFIMALANLIWQVKSLPIILKLFIHYVLIALGFYFSFTVIGGLTKTSLDAFIMIAALSAVYLIIAVCSFAISKKITEHENERQEYKEVFKDAKQNK